MFNGDDVHLMEEISLSTTRGNDVPVQWRSAGVSELSKVIAFNPLERKTVDELQDEISLRPCHIRTFIVQLGPINPRAENSTTILKGKAPQLWHLSNIDDRQAENRVVSQTIKDQSRHVVHLLRDGVYRILVDFIVPEKINGTKEQRQHVK